VTTIRPALPSDAPAIAALHAESWRVTYRGILRDDFLDGPVFQDRRVVWETRLSEVPAPDTRLVSVIEHGGTVHAFIGVFLDVDPQWGALVDNLHVVPERKGHGLGRRLMAEAAAWVLQRRPASRLHLWVLEMNVEACGFYEHLGGTVTERRIHEAPDRSQVPAARYGWTDLQTLTAGHR
jgi:GNAT superfamily N-acetyltransferase